jgi:hypothetical protein
VFGYASLRDLAGDYEKARYQYARNIISEPSSLEEEKKKDYMVKALLFC